MKIILKSEMVFYFTLSDSSLVYCTYWSSVDVASKPYFLAGSNRKQIVFDRTSTERLVDKINDPLENIFSTPLIVFSVDRVRDGRTFLFTYRQKNQNRRLIQLRAASGRACNRFWTATDSISFHTSSLKLSFWTSRSPDCLL